MFHPQSRFLLSGALAATVLAAQPFSLQPVQAQNAPRGAVAPKDAPKIDAAAREVLDKMMATYKDAPSYAGNFQIQTTGFPDYFGINARLVFARPNRFQIFSEDTAGSQKIVSDGAALLYTISREPSSYVRVKAPQGSGALRKALTPIGADGTALATLLAGNDLLAGFARSLKSVSLGEAREGMDVVVVEFVERRQAGTVTYLIGKDDHILRSVTLSQEADGKTITSVETHRDVQIGGDLPASTFATEPPAGMQPVAEFLKPKYDPRLVVGGKPFEFPVRDLKGNKVSWDDYKGKVVLVDFWATWCPPCREEAPNVVRAYNTFKDDGFEVIGVSLDGERGALDAFTQQYGMTWRQIFDGRVWDSETSKLFGISSVPSTLLVGRDGKIAAIGTWGPYLARDIKRALNAEPPSTEILPQATEVLPQATEVNR